VPGDCSCCGHPAPEKYRAALEIAQQSHEIALPAIELGTPRGEQEELNDPRGLNATKLIKGAEWGGCGPIDGPRYRIDASKYFQSS
jgi:hypothetical protein